MSAWASSLILIGVASIAFSFAKRRHSAGDDRLIAVHPGMSDERVRDNIRRQRLRVDAKLGIQYGFAFIALGLVWQAILSLFWF